jgi:hypothetical protein
MKSFKQYLKESRGPNANSLLRALHTDDGKGGLVPDTAILLRIMRMRKAGHSDTAIGRHYGEHFNDGVPYGNGVVKSTLDKFRDHLGKEWVEPKFRQKGNYRPAGEAGPKDTEGMAHAVVGLHVLHGHSYSSIAEYLSNDVPGITRESVAGTINRAKKNGSFIQIPKEIEAGGGHPLYHKYKDAPPLNKKPGRNPGAPYRRKI